jgi:uncharacterized protein (TIGR03437 family)
MATSGQRIRGGVIGQLAWLAWVGIFGAAPTPGAVVSLPAEFAAPGSSVFLSIGFTGQADAVSGIQFDVHYDQSAMSLVAIVGDAARNSGKTLYQVDVGPDTRRFLIVGLNRTPIPDGVVVGLFANLSQDASGGVYPLTLSNVIGTDNAGQPAPATGLEGSVTVQGTVEQIVRLQPAGVLNGAGLFPGPVAAGEIVTLIGSEIGPSSGLTPVDSPSSTVLGGTSVLFDGTPAPLLYAGPDQINAIVPYAVSGNASTQVQIAREGRVVAGLTVPVLAAAPAIFTLDSSGVGPGAILNQDGSINSSANPADRGSVVVIFATGAGQTDPPGRDGQLAEDPFPKPVLAVLLRIGGRNAEVLYAGAAPGLVAGVLQVNCRVPVDVVPGHAVSVVLTVGAASSEEGVTLAVR